MPSYVIIIGGGIIGAAILYKLIEDKNAINNAAAATNNLSLEAEQAIDEQTIEPDANATNYLGYSNESNPNVGFTTEAEATAPGATPVSYQTTSSSPSNLTVDQYFALGQSNTTQEGNTTITTESPYSFIY